MSLISPTKIAFQPSSQLCVCNVYPKGGSKAREVRIIAELSHFVTTEYSVVSEATAHERFITRGMLGPSRKCAIEVDVDHNSTQVEQQCVYPIRLHGLR